MVKGFCTTMFLKGQGIHIVDGLGSNVFELKYLWA